MLDLGYAGSGLVAAVTGALQDMGIALLNNIVVMYPIYAIITVLLIGVGMALGLFRRKKV